MANTGSDRWSATALAMHLGDWAEPGRPLYVQLAERIAAIIREGVISDGEHLPSERALAKALGVSRSTTEACYDELRAKGAVASRRGVGTWCVGSGSPRRSRRPSAHFVRRLIAPSSTAVDMTVASLPAHHLVSVAATYTRGSADFSLRSHGYLPWGLESLRVEVAYWFEQRGVPTDPSQISITAGAAQALLMAGGLLEQNATVWVENPTSPTILSAMRWHDLRLRSAPADQWGVRPPSAEGGAVVVTPAYLNPSGACLSDARCLRLAQAALTTPTIVIEDLTLADLRLDGPTAHSVAAHAPEGNVLSIGSMSKLFWAGMRLGWIRAPRHLVSSVMQLKGALDLGTAIHAQAQAAWLLRHRDEVAADRATLLRPRRDALVEALSHDLPNWTFAVPAGGLSLWVRLPDDRGLDIVTRALRAGIAVLGGSSFDVEGRDNRHLRLPFVQTSDVLIDVVRRLAAAEAE